MGEYTLDLISKIETYGCQIKLRDGGLGVTIVGGMKLPPDLLAIAKQHKEAIRQELIESRTSIDLLQELGVRAVLVTNSSEAERHINSLITSEQMIGLDFETTPLDGYEADHQILGPAGLDPLRSRPRLVQLYAGGDTVVVIDLDHVRVETLLPLWDGRLVAHNAIFETRILDLISSPAPIIDCTLLVYRHLYGCGASLAQVAAETLRLHVPKAEQTSDWSLESGFLVGRHQRQSSTSSSDATPRV